MDIFDAQKLEFNILVECLVFIAFASCAVRHRIDLRHMSEGLIS